MNRNDNLIEKFLSAIKDWSVKANDKPFTIVFLANVHLGMLSEDKSNDTRFNFRDKLYSVVDNGIITQSALISGLIKIVEIHLIRLAEGYDDAMDNARSQQEFIEQVQNDKSFRDAIIQEFHEANPGHDLTLFDDPERLRIIGEFWAKQVENVDDNAAERKMKLYIWQEVTQPILEYKNFWPYVEAELKSLNDKLGPKFSE